MSSSIMDTPLLEVAYKVNHWRFFLNSGVRPMVPLAGQSLRVASLQLWNSLADGQH